MKAQKIIKKHKDKNKIIVQVEKQSFLFSDKEPEIGAHISLVWEDGSDCECVYEELDKSILPLPTHWYYVKRKG